MRLICPNCDAQYEVPDDVMPAAGRDVQCSNCGNTWFQHHPDNPPDDIPPDTDEQIAPATPAPAGPERKQLDPAVADILRQEAEAEKAARRAAVGTGLESQPDLGLDMADTLPEEDNGRRTREARERMNRLRSDEPEIAPKPTEVAASAALGSRRDLLPDIEEINSTLRSGSGRAGAGPSEIEPEIEAPSYQRKRRGFRTGFLTVLLVFILLVILYLVAPRLAAAVPALDGALQVYVGLVDQLRVWLDARVQGLLQSLDSAAQTSGS